jgi:antitoxin component YwqK of YwqJK toxin-antitoxin module
MQNGCYNRYSKSMKVKFVFGLLLLCFSPFAVAQNDYNKLDENGKKHGLWKGFYEESKRPRYEGTFEHGKEVGVFNFFDDTKAKSVIATREFNTKDNSVYTTFFDQKKNKVSEGKEVNRKYEGQWKYYHKESSAIMSLDNYKDGKLDGKRSVFYPKGKIAEEINFKNGLKEGPYKSYTQSGVVIEETNYKNGEYDGPAIYRESSGKIASEGNYVKGKKRGIWKFYQDGKLVKQQNMSKENTSKLGDSRSGKK